MKKNIFKKLFYSSKLQSTKLSSYFEVYNKLFKPYVKRPITFVEVGVYGGGSLNMWKKYFHPKSRIIGIDLNPEALKLRSKGFEIFIGDQGDSNFWMELFKKIGKIDILLDDGGHTDAQQIQTLISAIPQINSGGIIAIEDVHASYLTEFGNPSKYSFINYCKKIIDVMNYRYINLKNFNNDQNKIFKLFQKNIFSINFFESFIVFHIDGKKCINSKILRNMKMKKIKDFRNENEKYSILNYIFLISKYLPSSIYSNNFVKRFGKKITRFLINLKKKNILNKYKF